MNSPEILIIGGAVADISLCAVSPSIFAHHSTPIDTIRLSTGGDALNEASVLARLGKPPRLVTLLGKDDIGTFLLTQCRERGIDTRDVICAEEERTSINAVLVDELGERRFVTAKNTTLRRLAPCHVQPALTHLEGVKLVSFASIFVSPCFGVRELKELFSAVKQKGLTLCADMTRRKKGESAQDMRPALQYVDYLFPNLDEGALLTGKSTPEDITQTLLDCGVKHVVLKLGSQGCCVADRNGMVLVPAYPNVHVLDTTGAGDTFVGAFLYALSQGNSPIQCASFANAAASICVEHTGCASDALTLNTVEKRLAHITSDKNPTKSLAL